MIKRCSRSWHERTNRLGRKKSRTGTMDHCKKTNGHSYNERFSFSMEKLNSKQNMNPKVAATNEYMRVRSWMIPCKRPYGLQDDTRANGSKDCVAAA